MIGLRVLYTLEVKGSNPLNSNFLIFLFLYLKIQYFNVFKVVIKGICEGLFLDFFFLFVFFYYNNFLNYFDNFRLLCVKHNTTPRDIYIYMS